MKGQIREYTEKDSIVFMKAKEAYGVFANTTMDGAGVTVFGRPCKSTENPYQALKFPDDYELQERILYLRGSMDGKALAREMDALKRPDWSEVSFAAMRWCVGLKASQNFLAMNALMQTGDKPIVEKSFKDTFWGAKPVGGGKLIGCNFLGRIWMELRRDLLAGPLHPDKEIREDFPWEIKNLDKLSLFGEPLPPIVIPKEVMPHVQFPSMLPKGANMFDRIREQQRLRAEAEARHRQSSPMYAWAETFELGFEGKFSAGVDREIDPGWFRNGWIPFIVDGDKKPQVAWDAMKTHVNDLPDSMWTFLEEQMERYVQEDREDMAQNLADVAEVYMLHVRANEYKP